MRKIIFIALAALPLQVASALAEDASPPPEDCWKQFMEDKGPKIACAFPAVMEDADRVEIRKLSRDMLQDARCTVSVAIDRKSVDDAAKASDMTFTTPPQPVSCEIVTSRGALLIAFTFTPRIDIKDGKAVKATPGMADVTGVNSWLAWPVVAYINRSSAVQDGMLQVVNAYLQRRREAAAE